MKLPQYDNRPSAGQPLYNSNKVSLASQIMMPILFIGLPIFIIGLIATGIYLFIRNF